LRGELCGDAAHAVINVIVALASRKRMELRFEVLAVLTCKCSSLQQALGGGVTACGTRQQAAPIAARPVNG
jgi:hypothetical protein